MRVREIEGMTGGKAAPRLVPSAQAGAERRGSNAAATRSPDWFLKWLPARDQKSGGAVIIRRRGFTQKRGKTELKKLRIWGLSP